MKIYRKDLGNTELEVLMRPEIDSLMQQVVPRQQQNAEPVNDDAENTSNQEDSNRDSHNVSSEEKEYLESIFNHPFLTITGRAEALGLTSYMNDKIKKELTHKGLANDFSVNFGRFTKGNVKFMELKEAGYLAIGKSAPKSRKYSCSSEHWLWQTLIQQYYQSKGYQAIIEMRMQDKRADVGICKNGVVLAAEVELSAGNAVFNVTTDLKVGFDKVLVACKNTKVKQAVQKKLELALDEQQWKQVQIMLLSDFHFVKDIIKGTKA